MEAIPIPQSKMDAANAFPNFAKPKIVGEFSLDSQRTYVPDRSGLKFLVRVGEKSKKARVRINLDAGVDRAIPKDDDDSAKYKIQNLLRWLARDGARVPRPDFVCYRGLMTTVMCTPFENKEGWSVLAVAYGGTIYLHKEETEEAVRRRENMDRRQRRMCSWGYKFEQCLLADTPREAVAAAENPIESKEAVNENEEFCCMFKTALSGRSIVYGAEMDGIVVSEQVSSSTCVDAVDLNSVEFVELKTSRQPDHPGQVRTLRRFKQIKWWCQSFLVGIPKVVCGFRDDDGVVRSLETFEVRAIPRDCGDYWRPNVCMNFLDWFMSAVASAIRGADDLAARRFTWSPGASSVTCSVATIEEAEELLPQWFRESRPRWSGEDGAQ